MRGQKQVFLQPNDQNPLERNSAFITENSE